MTMLKFLYYNIHTVSLEYHFTGLFFHGHYGVACVSSFSQY